MQCGSKILRRRSLYNVREMEIVVDNWISTTRYVKMITRSYKGIFRSH